MTSSVTRPRRHYWLRGWSRSTPPPGEELAALRRGAGREPGSVPGMWPFYTTLTADGHPSAALNAEHAALVLFAVHQQGRLEPVHRDGVGVGQALRQLNETQRYSAEAIDRRVTAAATAATLSELVVHLRGLVQQMRTAGTAGLDYTRLYRDLVDWQNPERLPGVRRRWGAAYFNWTPRPGSTTKVGVTPATAVPAATAPLTPVPQETP